MASQLRLVKELCEGKENCKIIPSQILAQHAKCQKVEERKLWVKYSCNGGQDVTTKQSTQFCNSNTCTSTQVGIPKQVDVYGHCGGFVHLACTGGCLKIDLVAFDCEMGTGSNPSQLRLVKELCEGKDNCKIIPSQILAQHANCQKVEERKLWVKYSCNGGQDVTTKQSTQSCKESCDPPCTGGSYCQNSQCICEDGFNFVGVPGNGECISKITPTPAPNSQCSQSCTGGQTCQSISGKWECLCPNGLTFSNGWCVDKVQCTGQCKCHGRCTSDQECSGGSTCQSVDGNWNCVCRKGFYCDGGTCHEITTTVTQPTPTPAPAPVPAPIPTPAPSPIVTPPQGQCPPASKETSISKDISLDGGWVKINREGGCIQIQKCMAACEPGAQLPSHLKIGESACNGKSSCELHPTSAQFGVSCSGWRRLWIMWKCKDGKDRSTEFIDESKKPNGWNGVFNLFG